MSKIFKRIVAELLVFLVKILSLSKKIAVSLGSLFVLKPGKSVLRVFFYKFVVKAYSAYYTTARRLGWKGRDAGGFKLGKELVHISVIVAVLAVVGINFANSSRAQDVAALNERNILASLVTAEFGSQEDDILIEETAEEAGSASPVIEQQNQAALGFVEAHQRVARELEPEEDMSIPEEELTDIDHAYVKPGQGAGDAEIARREVIAYEVQDGDTISTIAEKFNIGVSTILWENNLSVSSLIRPGDKLRILPMSGISHQVAKGESLKSLAAYFNINEQDIVNANDLIPGQSLALGQKLLIPGGKKQEYASFKPKTYSGVAVVKNVLDPVKRLVKPKSKGPTIANRMSWPTVGYRISQYFSWSHLGLDVANRTGTPLYAADSGVIESAGWGRGYGNNIVVNHGGGKKTRYAHMNKFYVSRGDRVEKGEQLGEMGNTGWSTGPHIHFEVMINGTKYNPLNYVR